MNLYLEAREIAQNALDECDGDIESAQEFIHQTCDGHEIAIYYHKGIAFCAEQNTNDGERYLEDCGGICQPSDAFGQIACRIAYATLYIKSLEALEEINSEKEG